MKKLLVFLVVCLVSVFSFAKCDFFQVANDCNGQSTTIIAKNDTVSLDIHANWNQGNIAYKFQSGAEKLDVLIKAPANEALDVTMTYKNKSAKMTVDVNSGNLNVQDSSALFELIASLDPSFLLNCKELVDSLPEGTSNLEELKLVAQTMFAQEPPPQTAGILKKIVRAIIKWLVTLIVNWLLSLVGL